MKTETFTNEFAPKYKVETYDYDGTFTGTHYFEYADDAVSWVDMIKEENGTAVVFRYEEDEQYFRTINI